MSKNIVHVIGTGTIGEPLIGLLSVHRKEFNIDEVTFNKNSARQHDRPKLTQLLRRGARLAAKSENHAAFKEMGIEVAYEAEEAIRRATVVIDCTPSGVGLANKQQYFLKYADQVKGFIAQGSEFGFGKMYARGINDDTIDPKNDQFIHVVSCNTHNLAALLRTLGSPDSEGMGIKSARFLCLRRANDISQNQAFIPAPQVGKHSDEKFGTHHARDAHHLFRTLGHELNVFSSAVKLNTQYMHAVHFAINLTSPMTREEAIARFADNTRIALTEKSSANEIFSFGREHGHYGRILSQTVMSVPTVTIRHETEVVGFCFTPQDGNSLLSSIAATLRILDEDTLEDRIDCLRPYLFKEV